MSPPPSPPATGYMATLAASDIQVYSARLGWCRRGTNERSLTFLSAPLKDCYLNKWPRRNKHCGLRLWLTPSCLISCALLWAHSLGTEAIPLARLCSLIKSQFFLFFSLLIGWWSVVEEQRGLLCGKWSRGSALVAAHNHWCHKYCGKTHIQVKDVKIYFVKRKVTHMETIGEKFVEVILWQ